MKKFLLSLAAVACAASMSATSYTVFDISAPGNWTGDANGWKSTTTVGGKTFNLETKKVSTTCSDLVSPVENTNSWKVYKGSSVTIASSDVTMKQIIVTFDTYSDNKYISTMTLSSGWTGTLAENVYTLVNAGASEIIMTAEEKQVRIKSIVVSDEAGSVDPPIGPELPEGVIYQNAFNDNLDGWEKINDASLSDFNGWKIQKGKTNAPDCALCNAYYGGTNHPANAKMQYNFDLTNYTEVELSFEQAYGYDFPQTQVDNYRVYVVSGGNTEYLTMANFPAAPESGNWTREWPVNTFDLSEYDGMKIAIGFEYATDGSKSRAWELRNFVLKGNSKGGAVDGIEADDNVAPVYYNLQGVRVNNPENGLFIVVKGSKVSKVIL